MTWELLVEAASLNGRETSQGSQWGGGYSRTTSLHHGTVSKGNGLGGPLLVHGSRTGHLPDEFGLVAQEQFVAIHKSAWCL